MAIANTGSIIEGEGGRNQTQTAVSTNIIIEVDGNPIGAVQDFSVKESRQVTMIDEVGHDGHIDSVPNKSVDISGSCRRVRFNNLRAFAAFSRGFIHLAAQRIPFDIIIKDTFAGDDPGSIIVTTVKNVWLTSLNIAYRASDFTIVEDFDWQAETIYSTMGANNNAIPAAAGGRQLTIIDNNPIERETDRGGSRGALSAAGLLLAVDEIL